MKELTENEITQIRTAAFVGYVMSKEGCGLNEALQIMAKLTTATQIALGLGEKRVPNPEIHGAQA